MKALMKILIAALIVGGGTLAYDNLPVHYKREVQGWYARLWAPAFIASPDGFSGRPQDDVIRELKNKGHELTCYGNLQREERINARNDFLCSAYISTAYDNIPARMVTYFFSKGALSNVRIEFPSSSFAQVQDYLSRKMAGRTRLDKLPHNDFGTDNFGARLMVWAVPDGLLVTSSKEVPGHPTILLWSSLRPQLE